MSTKGACGSNKPSVVWSCVLGTFFPTSLETDDQENDAAAMPFVVFLIISVKGPTWESLHRVFTLPSCQWARKDTGNACFIEHGSKKIMPSNHRAIRDHLGVLSFQCTTDGPIRLAATVTMPWKLPRHWYRLIDHVCVHAKSGYVQEVTTTIQCRSLL